MNVRIDQDLCISCGLCVNNCPDVFAWNRDDKAEVIQNPVVAATEGCCRESIDGCPTQAIAES